MILSHRSDTNNHTDLILFIQYHTDVKLVSCMCELTLTDSIIPSGVTVFTNDNTIIHIGSLTLRGGNLLHSMAVQSLSLILIRAAIFFKCLQAENFLK